MMLQRYLRETAILLILSLAVAVGVNAVRPAPLPWRKDFSALRQAPMPAEERLTSAQAKALHGRADVLFVDARDAASFGAQRVAGAFSLPFDPFAPDLEARMAALPKDKTLLIYCGSGGCALSEELAQTLKAYGFSNVKVLAEGIEGWVAAGGPLEGAGVKGAGQ